MKKRKMISAAALVLLATMMPIFASAQGDVVFSGTVTDPSVKWVTTMTIQSKADKSLPGFNDIGWINQVRVNDNRTYVVKVPLSQFNGEYELMSNQILKQSLYVSQSNGLDSNDGSRDAPFKTLAKALETAESGSTIVLCDMITIPKNTQLKCDKSNIIITGRSEGEAAISGGLDLTSTVGLHIKFSATLENMTIKTIKAESISENANKIFACGNKLVFGEGLTMSNPIDVLGGNSINNSADNTDIVIKSGSYRRIYGGGEQSPVTGDTHITIYGMNDGCSANDDSSDYYDSRIFGGGKNSGADVGGNTHIDFRGGTAAYLVGGGSAANVAGNTYIDISAGRVMNVYGATADKKTVHNADTYITMTGGTAESLFGGAISCMMNGNTHVSVTGGEVLRRIYGGCYNDWEGSWESSCYVYGSTAVLVGANAKIATGGDLSWSNKLNSGIFAGSRMMSNSDEEKSVIIFNEAAFDTIGAKLAEQSAGYKSVFLSHHDYLVKSALGGTCEMINGEKIRIKPDNGKKAIVNNIEFFGGDYTLDTGETEIGYENGYTVTNADATVKDGETVVNAKLLIGNEGVVTGKEKLIAAVYNADKTLNEISMAKIMDSGDYELKLENERCGTYTVRLYVWNMEQLKPLAAAYALNFGE